MAKQEFSYIDPAHDKEDTKQVNLYMANLNKFIDSHPQWSKKIMNRTWKVKVYQHPKQNFAVDAISCGVFVIYFIAQLMVHDHINMDFDPLAFRDFLCREFLKESKDMLNRCLACGR